MHLFFYVLTYFQPKFHFYNPWNHLKTVGFLMPSGALEKENWLEMG